MSSRLRGWWRRRRRSGLTPPSAPGASSRPSASAPNNAAAHDAPPPAANKRQRKRSWRRESRQKQASRPGAVVAGSVEALQGYASGVLDAGRREASRPSGKSIYGPDLPVPLHLLPGVTHAPQVCLRPTPVNCLLQRAKGCPRTNISSAVLQHLLAQNTTSAEINLPTPCHDRQSSANASPTSIREPTPRPTARNRLAHISWSKPC
jgi:hypothetical protein